MTENTVDHVLAVLREQLQSRIETYRSQWDDPVPVTLGEASPDGADDAPRATQADIDELFDTILDFYDDLLDVDSTPYRDEWRQNLRYDCPPRQIVADLRANPRHAPRTCFGFNGSYMVSTGLIGISRTPVDVPNAALTLASELLHACQDVFDSPTFDHPLFEEGADVGARTLAFAHLADVTDRPAWFRIASGTHIYLRLAGYATINCRRGGLTTADLSAVGLTDDEIDRFQSGRLGRAVGPLLPSIRWGIDLVDYDYNVGGALVLAGTEQFGSEFIVDLFHGEGHPWTAPTAEITELVLQRPSYRLEQAPKAILPW